jgi:hypothetical protein
MFLPETHLKEQSRRAVVGHSNALRELADNAEQIGLDGAFNILKEFRPDMNRIVFRDRY